MAAEAGASVVWFRDDLRLEDHAALAAAIASGHPVLAVYVLDEEAAGGWKPGGASRWWLHHSLAAHGEALAEAGARLVLRRGDTIQHLTEIARDARTQTVYCQRHAMPWAAQLEGRVHDALAVQGVTLRRFAGALLHDPDRLKTKSGGPFKVYTPFWRALAAGDIRSPVARPMTIDGFKGRVASEELGDWRLLPTAPDWAGGLRENWQPGENAARAGLERFLDGPANRYPEARDLPAVAGTSRLSAHLHFGEISPAACWHATQAAVETGRLGRAAAEKFLKELAWREFSYHLLHHNPDLPDRAFRPEFANFPWDPVEGGLTAWRKGATGYPIVDAGMRELWHTGWMHNRVRMITASFLIKHLMVPWQDGEAWFWDCLVDADLASNAASWQWVAGSGADAAPYFRIFNPVLQGEKFDAEGAYVRRWVPEIAGLPDKYVHKPWEVPAKVLAAAGVTLGETYPRPVVDHAAARAKALAAFEALRK